MLELFTWKERELRSLKKDLEELMERFMALYGLESDALEDYLLRNVELREKEERLLIELVLPELSPGSLRVYLSGDALIIVGQRHGARTGRRSYRKVIELPFAPREGEVQVNFRPPRLSIEIARPKKRSYRLSVSSY